jgi:UDP-galactopyranose mutase
LYFKNVIVGAGLAGATIARRITDELNEPVLIVEKRNEIGGNLFDYFNEFGILVHKHGPHIFHTNNNDVWKWLSRFTDWIQYQHLVKSFVDGKNVSFPISLSTVNELTNSNLTLDEYIKWVEINLSTHEKDGSSKYDIFNNRFLSKFYLNYSRKQWGETFSKMDKSVFNRISIRLNNDTRYFTDRFQGLPKLGYTRMFQNILDDEKISVMLNASWKKLKENIEYENLYYTGRIDEFFDFKYGTLQYRSCKFQFETFMNRQFYQECAVVNYPNDYEFTRITEFKHMTGQTSFHTTIAREFPSEDGEPYYVVTTAENTKILNKYIDEAAKQTNLCLAGRLAEYKYYNMDALVEKILNMELIKKL